MLVPKRRRQSSESSSLTSATPQKLPKKQKALFRDVLMLLNQAGVPFAVSGAIALQKHTGICRDTKEDCFSISSNNDSPETF